VRRFIGNNCFVIAEIGANHQQSFRNACELIYAASEAGADAVKIQMFRPESLTLDKDDKRFRLTNGPWKGQTLFELYQKAYLPYEWVPKLKELADGLGVKFITSVYDTDTVDIAEKMEIEAYKIASFEITELDLIAKVALTGKPVFISTGTASAAHIVKVKETIGHKKVAFLKCTSQYPAAPETMNLKTILDMRRWLGTVGLSDHTQTIAVPVAAVALGARIIEKHLKIGEEGLDASFSIDPIHFTAMVAAIRTAEKALGNVVYGGKAILRREKVSGKSVRVIERDKNEKGTL